jgi:aldehyde:ferredoxin oxidoreductase
MTYAFMGKVLRVHLTRGEVWEEETRLDWARDFLGGAGLATRYLYDLAPTGVDPLGPENPLIFMTGLLTGTASASASRYSVVARSPLTGIWGHANSGGSFGPALKRSGYDGIIFEGSSPSPVYLEIINGQARLKSAEHLWGKTVTETEDLLQDSCPQTMTIASIGPAGESQVLYAAIMNNKHRAAGRCGLGAVMGSKRLKAIACSGKAQIQLADADGFHQTARRQIELLDESILRVGFETFGTNMVSDMVNVRGGYPTRNWQSGVYDEIESVNAQALTDGVLVDGVRCFACPVACGRGTEIREGRWAGMRGEGPEYETINTFGPLCGVSDINEITRANYLCNQLGLDTISAGTSIAFAMECAEQGLLTPEQTGGIEIRFGDPDVTIKLLELISTRQGVGDLLAQGTRRMAKILGQGSSHFAMNVKGLELPAYDPRAAKICGVGYVTANRGGDHITAYVQGPTFIDLPFLLIEDSTIKDPFTADPSENRVLIDLENALTALDCLGGCKFMGILLTAEDLTGLVSGAAGWDFDTSAFRKAGERVYNLARAYSNREGLNRQEDALPGRLLHDPLPDGPAAGMLIDPPTLEMMKDAYYEMRGWDLPTGIPGPAKLHELGLDFLVSDLWHDREFAPPSSVSREGLR